MHILTNLYRKKNFSDFRLLSVLQRQENWRFTCDTAINDIYHWFGQLHIAYWYLKENRACVAEGIDQLYEAEFCEEHDCNKEKYLLGLSNPSDWLLHRRTYSLCPSCYWWTTLLVPENLVGLTLTYIGLYGQTNIYYIGLYMDPFHFILKCSGVCSIPTGLQTGHQQNLQLPLENSIFHVVFHGK